MGESNIGESYFLILFTVVAILIAIADWWSGRK